MSPSLPSPRFRGGDARVALPRAGRDARVARVVRGAIAASVATTLAATAHTLGGGTPPAWWLIAAVTALILPVSVLLVGRRGSTVRTVLAVCAAQAALHSVYAAVGGVSAAVGGVSAAVGGTTAATTPALVTRIGHAAHHAPVMLTTSVTHLHVDAPMIATHLIAAAVTIVLLVRGEATARALARGVRTGIRRLLDLVATPAPPADFAVPTPLAERVIPAAVFLAAMSRRGPPLPAL